MPACNPEKIILKNGINILEATELPAYVHMWNITINLNIDSIDIPKHIIAIDITINLPLSLEILTPIAPGQTEVVFTHDHC